MAIKVIRTKELIGKRVVTPIKSVGKSMPKIFSVGLILMLGSLSLP